MTAASGKLGNIGRWIDYIGPTDEATDAVVAL